MHLIRKFLLFPPLFYTFSCIADNADLKGSKDHPLLNRYPDTHIIEYRASDYDELEVRTSKSVNDNGAFKHPSNKVGGKLTTIEYQSNGKAPFIQVLRNFEEGLKKAGFKEIFSCDGEDTCGPLFAVHAILETRIHSTFRDYPTSTDSSNGSRFGYWSGTLTRNNGDVMVSVLIGEDGKYREKADIIVDIIESRPMENNLVAVNPKFLSESLMRDGKAVLNGILFDTDKDTIKRESSSALSAIADYLSLNKSANVFIVGHTDTMGSYQHNVDLSSLRAAAVAAALVKDFKIDSKRLQPIGIGPAAPMSSNASESGRAGNRRVEMVLQ